MALSMIAIGTYARAQDGAAGIEEAKTLIGKKGKQVKVTVRSRSLNRRM